jgi:hypothetical protein
MCLSVRVFRFDSLSAYVRVYQSNLGGMNKSNPCFSSLSLHTDLVLSSIFTNYAVYVANSARAAS